MKRAFAAGLLVVAILASVAVESGFAEGSAALRHKEKLPVLPLINWDF